MTTVLISGASRGIGAQTAHQLVTAGATVYAGARRPDQLTEQLTEQLTGDPGGPRADSAGELRPIALDVTDDASVAAAARRIEDEVGSLDVLVNNAGVPGSWAGPTEVGPEDFRGVLEVNVLGAVRLTRAFLPLLQRGDRPRLVMVSSGMGSLGLQGQDPAYAGIAHLPYPASKAALNMLAVQYAKALPQVLVTAVDPGLTATQFTAGAGHSVETGAEAVIAAALDTAGPSGRFLDRRGPAPW